MTTHQRKCWNCQTVNEHHSDVTPGVCCPRCGSQDTRRIREKAVSAADYLKNHCLAQLPLTFDEVATIYDNASFSRVERCQKLCMSHERLRAEVSGAEILIEELKTEIQCLKDQLQQTEIDAGKAIEDAKYQAEIEAEREMRREVRG